jgi:hypothetical protein
LPVKIPIQDRRGRRSRYERPARLRRFAATARHPSLGLPSRSSFVNRQARLRVASRRYGAASFAWLAEPKLTLRRKLA